MCVRDMVRDDINMMMMMMQSNVMDTTLLEQNILSRFRIILSTVLADDLIMRLC
jgi:hypothetical protein